MTGACTSCGRQRSDLGGSPPHCFDCSKAGDPAAFGPLASAEALMRLARDNAVSWDAARAWLWDDWWATFGVRRYQEELAQRQRQAREAALLQEVAALKKRPGTDVRNLVIDLVQLLAKQHELLSSKPLSRAMKYLAETAGNEKEPPSPPVRERTGGTSQLGLI